MNINNTSLDGFLQGASDVNSVGVQITDRTCLIMDEVDGMSALPVTEGGWAFSTH